MSNLRKDDKDKANNKFRIKKQYNKPEQGDVVLGNKYGLDENAVEALINNAVAVLSQQFEGVPKNNENLIAGVRNELVKQIFDIKNGQADIRGATQNNFKRIEAHQQEFTSQIMTELKTLANRLGGMEKALSYFRSQSEKAADDNYDRFSKWQEKQIENARKNLIRETSREHPNIDNVKKCALVLSEMVPDDFLARFYLAAYSENYRDEITFLNEINVGEHTQEEIKEVIDHITKHLRSEWILSASALIERSSSILGEDENSFRKEIRNPFEREVQKIERGTYNVTPDGCVFIAYNHDDIAEVSKLIDFLEEAPEIRCFAAFRNVRNGLGAEEYDKILHRAMSRCSVFVLYSTYQSRNTGGSHDEMDYIMEADYSEAGQNGHTEFKNRGDYKHLPAKYKKPRIEYLKENYRPNEANSLAKMFFGDARHRTEPTELRNRILDLLHRCEEEASEEQRKAEEARKIEEQHKEEEEVARKAEEQRKAEEARRAEEQRKAEEARKAEEQRKAEETRKAEEQRKAEETRKAEEQRKAEEARKAEEQRKAEEARKAEEQRKAEEARKSEEQRKAEAARKAEELKQKPWFAPDYPTLEDYDKTQFEIEGTTLKKYLKEDFAGEVKIPRGVTSIGENAFEGCSGLTSITIPNGVNSISNWAFSGCSGLTSITIPNSVTSIGLFAFASCSGLTSITIPNRVTSIGEGPFDYCAKLEKIKVEEGNSKYRSEGNCIIETSTKKLIAGCKNSIIPGSVTSIGERAFSGRSGLTSITIPNRVTSIGECAFCDCSGLTSITIPNSVKSIGEFAFARCSGLTSITIPNRVTSIGKGAFTYCAKLEKIKVEEGNSKYRSERNCIIKIFTNTLIAGCKNSIIPKSVKSIGERAFEGCNGLTLITIPNSVNSIGKYAFLYCSELKSITIPNSVKSIGEFAFARCSGLTSITIPNSVNSIGDRAFSGCSGLTSIKLPDGLKSIRGYAFQDCSGLTSITIPNSVKSIGGSAFQGCSGLTSITIPNSVKSIGWSAFYGCSGLTSITIPNSVTSIGTFAFAWCSGLTSITIPNSVKSIWYSAFSYCIGLTSITIPNSVTSIGPFAFVGCIGLTSVFIPKSVKSIGECAFFWWGTNLTIYCEASEQPSGWNANWNSDHRPVVWGYKK